MGLVKRRSTLCLAREQRDISVSAPSAPAEPCLAGGGAPSPLGGGAGCSRGAAAPDLPAGDCPGRSRLRALARRVYLRQEVDGCCVDLVGVL